MDEIMLEELVGDKVVKVCDNHKTTLVDDDDDEEDDLEKKANIDSMDAPAFSRMLEFLNIEVRYLHNGTLLKYKSWYAIEYVCCAQVRFTFSLTFRKNIFKKTDFPP